MELVAIETHNQTTPQKLLLILDDEEESLIEAYNDIHRSLESFNQVYEYLKNVYSDKQRINSSTRK